MNTKIWGDLQICISVPLKDEAKLKILSCSNCSPGDITTLPADRFPNKLAPNVDNNILINSPF